MAPAVSIIVPCRNEKDHIEASVRSILEQQSVPGGIEIIVADGMSDDGTRETLNKLEREDRRLVIIDNPGRIVAAGFNLGVKIARGDVIIRMDAHTRYAPDYIHQCVAVLKETGTDNVGGPWVAEAEGYIGRAVAAAFQLPFAVGGARGHEPTYEGPVDTVYLGCWPRKVFDQIGPFDEELVRNQDDEFNLRLRRAGGKIWQSPRIKSWYDPRESLRSLFKQQMQYGYWKVRVIQKHKIPASVRHLIPGSFLLSLIILTLAAPWSRLAAWCWIGLAGLYFVSNLVASILAAARAGWTLFPVLPFVFACYHFGYGYGFLDGLLDFVILRRTPTSTYAKLTRNSEDPLQGREWRVAEVQPELARFIRNWRVNDERSICRHCQNPVIKLSRMPPFHPSERFPEYPFENLSAEPNDVYTGFRDLLITLRLDEAHFNTKEWNPLGRNYNTR